MTKRVLRTTWKRWTGKHNFERRYKIVLSAEHRIEDPSQCCNYRWPSARYVDISRYSHFKNRDLENVDQDNDVQHSHAIRWQIPDCYLMAIVTFALSLTIDEIFVKYENANTFTLKMKVKVKE